MGVIERSKRQLFINLIAGLMNFIVVAGINFVLTPVLTESLGDEAYGFIGLANNFASYSSILSVALNSMAARFISMEFHKSNSKRANEYFSSVFIADLIMAGVLSVVAVSVVCNLEKFLHISEHLVTDVKITFLIVFINSIVVVISSVFGVAVFVVNRLDLGSVRQILSKVVNVVLVVIFFSCFKPRIYFICIAVLGGTVYLTIANMKLTKQLLPDFCIRRLHFKVDAVKEIVSSGVWNSLNQLNSMLLTGLDLLIANLFLDEKSMGILSVAKTIPTALLALLGTIGNIFTPVFTELYAKGKKKQLEDEVNFSIKVFSFLMTVPIIGFIVYGYEFYSLWLPNRPTKEILVIQILSVITLGPNIFSSYIYSLYSVNTVTNKLKVPVLVTFGVGVVSTILVLILVSTTELGVYAVAGVSSALLIVRVLFFVPTYAAHNLELPLFTFYRTFFKAIGCAGVLFILFAFFKKVVVIDSWWDLIACGLIFGMCGYIVNLFLILNKSERLRLKNMILKRKK